MRQNGKERKRKCYIGGKEEEGKRGNRRRKVGIGKGRKTKM